MKKQNGFTSVELALCIIFFGGAGGWIANVVKLAGMEFANITGMLVLRAIGVVVVPLGAVLGFF